jgi:hypothetical protein
MIKRMLVQLEHFGELRFVLARRAAVNNDYGDRETAIIIRETWALCTYDNTFSLTRCYMTI